MNWISMRSGSPPVRTPPQSIPAGDKLMASGMEGMHKTGQTALQPSQPLSEQTHTGTADDVIQENLPTTPYIHQKPLGRLSVMGERRVNDIGTNTSDVVVESTRNRPKHQVWKQMLRPPNQLLIYYCLLVLGIM